MAVRGQGGGRGVYPGTFNPPTIAHVAIAEAALHQAGLDGVDLVISEVALGKEALTRPTPAQRIEVLRALRPRCPWLGASLTSAQLLSDIAAGADAVIVGADKWDQIADPVWYGDSATERDDALERLPLVLIAPRPPFPLPIERPGRLQVLTIHPDHGQVSSSGVRAGRRTWMVPEAAAAGLWPVEGA